VADDETCFCSLIIRSMDWSEADLCLDVCFFLAKTKGREFKE
jgi:hypothetical protein